MEKSLKHIFIVLFILLSKLINAQTTLIPVFSCDQSTLVPNYTFNGGLTYTIAASPGIEEKVLVTCPNTIVYDTLMGAGRHALINSNCNYITKFGNSITLYVCFVKNTGTLTILPGAFPFSTVHLFHEPNAVIINQSSFSLNTYTCANISLPSYTCADAGIDEINANINNINISPNPVQDEMMVNTKTVAIDGRCTIKIYTALGQLVREEEVELNNTVIKITTKQLSNGIYIFSVKDKLNNTVSKKFVVAR